MYILDLRGVPNYPSLNASFLEEPIVVVSSHRDDKLCLDLSTRLLKRFISDDDSGVEHFEHFNTKDDLNIDHFSTHRLTLERDVDSGCFSDNVSTDSASVPSSLFVDLSFTEEDYDTSFLGTEQTRSMLLMHQESSAEIQGTNRPRSISEEIADVENQNQVRSKCSRHSHVDTQLYCESCEEMCCMNCKTVDHQDHNLTTINSVRTQRKTKLQKLISTTQEKLGDAEKTTAQLRDYNSQLQEQGRFIKNEITSRRQFLHQLVDRWHDKTTFQVETILQDEETYISNMIQTLEAQIKEMNKAHNEGQELINDLTEGYRFKDTQDGIENSTQI